MVFPYSRNTYIEFDCILVHLKSIEKHRDGVSATFERDRKAYTAAVDLAWKESQCCTWATFGVELPPGDDSVKWHVHSDREKGAELVHTALEEALRRFHDGSPPR